MEYKCYGQSMRKFWMIAPPVAVAAVLLGLIPAAYGQSAQPTKSAGPGVGVQYDAPHIYIQHGMEKAFVDSWLATFGGTATSPLTLDVTPTPSETLSDIILSPVGTLSVFDFSTGIPYPFGQESVGDMVSNFNRGVSDAVRSGATLLVSPFDDPVGQDAIVQFPGGVDIQLWRHFSSTVFAPLATIPDNRFYLDPAAANAFIRDWLAFSHGHIAVDDNTANGAEIGLPGTTYRKVLIDSVFGETLVIITNGHLPYPFGHDTMGYAVTDLTATLAKAKAAGAHVLWGPYTEPGLSTAIVEFPGGYICELHQGVP
jgi:hypothetical protein